MLWRQILLPAHKKTIFLRSKTFMYPGQKFCFRNMFPSIAAMKAMLTMIPNNGERTTMADGKVEVEEPQAGHRKGKEGKELKGRGD